MKKTKNIFETPALSIERDLYRASLHIPTLTKFHDVADLPNHAPYDSIKFGYRQRDLYSRVLSMLINGCIASVKSEFRMSQRTIVHYFDSDPNINIASIKGTVYSHLRDQLERSIILEVIEFGSKKNQRIQGGFLSRVYRVKDPLILKEIERNKRRLE